MPTYAYRCLRCGHEFPKFHKMNARVRPKCPQCGGPAERMITGGAGLLFKGSGFYSTDYRKGASTADAPGKAETPGPAAPADKADGTSKRHKSDGGGKESDS
jgi:putative FmdB family regulatory protein